MPNSVEFREDRKTEPAQQAVPRSFFRLHPHARWVLPLIAVAAAAAAIQAWRYSSIRENTDDAQINGHIVAISPRVAGMVQTVYVEENQFVKAGTVLFRLDPADYQVAVERAKADLAETEASAHGARTSVPITSTTTGSQLATAEAAVEVARTVVETARKEIEAAQARASAADAQIRQVEANHTKAAQDLERYKALVAKDEISRQQYDAAVAAESASAAGVAAAKAVTAAAGQDVSVAQSHLAQARARLAQAQSEVRAAQTAPEKVAVTRASANSAAAKAEQMRAALKRAELNLEYTTVRAPMDGVVSKKSVEAGVNLQPGQPVLAIVPLEDIWVTANFKETQLHAMHPGQKAIISVDTYGGRKYQGHVESISAATGEKFSLLPPENATGNYVKVVQRIPVRLRFEHGQDPEHLLRPGMSVVVTVITQ